MRAWSRALLVRAGLLLLGLIMLTSVCEVLAPIDAQGVTDRAALNGEIGGEYGFRLVRHRAAAEGVQISDELAGEVRAQGSWAVYQRPGALPIALRAGAGGWETRAQGMAAWAPASESLREVLGGEYPLSFAARLLREAQAPNWDDPSERRRVTARLPCAVLDTFAESDLSDQLADQTCSLQFQVDARYRLLSLQLTVPRSIAGQGLGVELLLLPLDTLVLDELLAP